MSKGRLFIVSGPSGSGKDTVLSGVFKQCPEVEFSISSITRDMRPGEREGEKYNFISREKFENMLKNDELLEHNIFVGNYYGTPKAPVETALNEGRDMIIEIDVNGAHQIRQKLEDTVSIFIMPPSLEVLKNRLSGRGTETAEVVEKRVSEAVREIKAAADYDYIVVNDDLNAAVAQVVSIINIDRLKTDRNLELINMMTI